jgi:hypothetical protein|tara:strand:+ start:283 stop:1056 length:774 start_codon:yes stop_codon:yes gene_type:complete
MARYDDLINDLLGKYIIGEGNRYVRDKKNKPKKSKGAPEQHMDEDEPDDDDTTEETKALKETIEGVGLAGIMGMGGTGEKYAPPGWSFVHDEDAEEHDKTGHLSDKELLAQVRKRGTAGKALLARAKSEIRNHKSITPETRDALARDLYAPWADEDESHKEKTFGGNKGDRVRRYNKKTGRKSEVRDYGSGSHPEESEERPSAGLSKKKKSAVAKKARAGGDIGKKGKGFDKVAKAAGGGEKGQKIAAAAMWKNVKR